MVESGIFFRFLPVLHEEFLGSNMLFSVLVYVGLDASRQGGRLRHKHKLCCLLLVLTFDIVESSS
jgi:hypothetical protein